MQGTKEGRGGLYACNGIVWAFKRISDTCYIGNEPRDKKTWPATKRQILNDSISTKYWKSCCQGIIGTLRCLSRCQVIRRCYAVSLGGSLLHSGSGSGAQIYKVSILNTKIKQWPEKQNGMSTWRSLGQGPFPNCRLNTQIAQSHYPASAPAPICL